MEIFDGPDRQVEESLLCLIFHKNQINLHAFSTNHGFGFFTGIINKIYMSDFQLQKRPFKEIFVCSISMKKLCSHSIKRGGEGEREREKDFFL